ncbi:MAG: hypothetical protein V1743_04630 [Nanoarchaeota archaeon]
MHDLEYKILTIFKKDPEKEFSTTEIVKEVFEKEYGEIKEALMSGITDIESKKAAHQKKGELHRKILYHLNKLVTDEILKISKTEAKGEKHFMLALSPGEYVIEKHQRKILISKPEIPSIPIDAYEEKKIIKKFDKESWVSRFNALLIQPHQHRDLAYISNLISKVFSYVNDAIGIYGFEQFIEKNTPESIQNFIHKLSIDCQDYNKEVSIIIELNQVKDQFKIIEFLETYAQLNPDKIHIIFSLDSQELQKSRKIIETAVRLFASQKRKVNIANRQLHSSPYIIGKAGTYTFNDAEWELLRKENIREEMMVCGQISLLIDVFRFYKHYSSAQEFRNMIMKAAKTLLVSNRIQRTNASHYFLELNRIVEPYASAFYFLSQNTIRFWNYDLERPEQQHFIELLESCKEEVEKFCRTEETIYKSCGIPIRFRIHFSSKFSRYDQEMFSQMTYIKSTIRKTKDLEKETITRFIEEREKLFKVFGGCDRMRFFRTGEYRMADIIHEFSHILNNHELAFFCYDFSDRRGDLSLHQFIE